MLNPRSSLCIDKGDQYPINALRSGVECENGLSGEVLSGIDHESIRADGDHQIVFVELIGWKKIPVEELLLE